MKKITCDLCGKDISDGYNTYDNCVLSYDKRETMDLCDNCIEKYYKVRNKCETKYQKLREKHENKMASEMKKYYDKEILKLKED